MSSHVWSQKKHNQDFLTVGSMGHCSSIALGLALERTDKKIVCIDGDGSLIMHMGNIATVGNLKPKNYYHILINNESHESVGGQPTSASTVDFTSLLSASGYKNIFYSDNKKQLKSSLENFFSDGPNFLEILVQKGSRSNLGRPTIEPINNKNSFMNFLKKS